MINEVLKGKRKRIGHIILEEIMSENFPKWMKDIKP
jgi:hypothetical protein